MKRKQKTVSSVGYTGNIEIKMLRGDRVIKTVKAKNAGKMPLFNFLAKCLVGQFESTGTPKYIMLGYTSSGLDADAEQVSSSAIPYSGVSMESQEVLEQALAVFKFLIPFSTIASGEVINCIRLYNSDIDWEGGSHCAYFILDEANKITSDGKSNILITWTMTVSNQTEIV